MRSSASALAVSIRIGTVEFSRTDFVRSKPLSPGIITSSTRRSKAKLFISARAPAASTAAVTR